MEELARVTADNPALGAFAVMVLDDAAIEVAVHGPLPVAVHRTGGIEVVEPGTGLLRRSISDAAVVAVTVPGAVVDPLLELERGTIAADGFEIRVSRAAGVSPWGPPVVSDVPAAPAAPEGPADSTGAVPRPEQPTPEPSPQPVAQPVAAAAAVVSLHAADEELPAAAPLPVGAPPPAAPPAHEHDHATGHDDRAVRVRGLQCSRGHFNDPRARYCGVCGIAMHQASFILVEDVRPPLGVLVFGDGSIQTLSRTSVVGRDPADDPAVRAGDAVGLALTDPTNTLSRVHAELRLVDWDVQLVDRGSTNGTFVWAAGQTAWERLAPDTPRALLPGTHVSFGRLTATFESSLRQG
jgi:hypothetical protein